MEIHSIIGTSSSGFLAIWTTEIVRETSPSGTESMSFGESFI